MKTQEIFDLAIKMGIEADLRGSKEVEKFLNRKKKKYEALSEREKDEFDIEALTNPYLDWNFFTAVSVPFPNSPSKPFGEQHKMCNPY